MYLNPLGFDDILQVYDLLKESTLLNVSPSAVPTNELASCSVIFKDVEELRMFLLKTDGIQKMEAEEGSK
jgi:hypothetical protein